MLATLSVAALLPAPFVGFVHLGLQTTLVGSAFRLVQTFAQSESELSISRGSRALNRSRFYQWQALHALAHERCSIVLMLPIILRGYIGRLLLLEQCHRLLVLRYRSLMRNQDGGNLL